MHDVPPNTSRVGSRAFYWATAGQFLRQSDDEVLGLLTRESAFAVDTTQRDAWLAQMAVLRDALPAIEKDGTSLDGAALGFEFAVPRVGKRIDVLLVLGHVLFVLEFKVGEKHFRSGDVNQVWDYALDLRNFHSTSHTAPIAPILIATAADPLPRGEGVRCTSDHDGVLRPLRATPGELPTAIRGALSHCEGPAIDAAAWAQGRYQPTPTIIDAAIALYGGHGVADITRNDASAVNLRETTDTIARVIEDARTHKRKAICFVTGVPGAGKTLVGLNIATEHIDKDSDLYSVFLSGNGPLVAVLREALARDKVARVKAQGKRARLGEARSEVKAFIQNVHNFRDECLLDEARPPIEHVSLFDEAQRAWNLAQTADFMRRKRQRPDFAMSEPAFLLSCMDRHTDWAVVVCLVGGGQEINRGEAGITEWLTALREHFKDWHIHLSPNLHDSEYAAGHALDLLQGCERVHHHDKLHLSVSMRSFRAEQLSSFVKHLLDLKIDKARAAYEQIRDRYPIVLTRSVPAARAWLRERARGSERYGIVVSSSAQRLKPHAIDVRVSVDPVHWFLDPREDVRSSYYLEDVATEFQVQGLELDWTAVVWDGDFRYTPNGWGHYEFQGEKWRRVKKRERQEYLKNAYRVLLTRARQGMVIVVPEGDEGDLTRAAAVYDPAVALLSNLLKAGDSR